MNRNFKKHLEASYTRAFEECARTGHKIGDLDMIFNSIAMGEFAELIVRECCDKFIDMQHKFHPSICVYEIKQHFGVEE